ncbi:MAG: hypothetical protein Q7R77_03800 [Candidatus Daviesbacteria bacterium]|nr:hypothetical protein [Candidatus Daviesbacteria bacterium]
MGEFLDYFKNKKNLANLLLLGILVLAIPLGVNLIKQQQILKSRATAAAIVFSGPNVKTIGSKTVATKPDVILEITAPGDTGSGGGGGGDTVATKCAGIIPWSQVDAELKVAKYDGLYDHSQTELDAYNRTRVCEGGSGGGGNGAPACDSSQVNMSVSPSSLNVGDQATFTVGGTQGSTWIGDSWSGGVDCKDGFWGSKTCKVTSAGSFTWTHKWQNTAPNKPDIKSPPCSNEIQFTTKDKVVFLQDTLMSFVSKGLVKDAYATDNCPDSQQEVAVAKIGQTVDGTVYWENGLCGYKYYNYKSTLAGGDVCASIVFGKWGQQDQCPVKCGDNPQSPPAGYMWKANCDTKESCFVTADKNDPNYNSKCLQNNFDAGNVEPSTSNWCYGFSSSTGGASTSSDFRCLMLVRSVCQSAGATQCGGASGCTLGNQTPDAGDACANCVLTNRTDLRPFYDQNGHRTCSNKQIVNDWCNGVSTDASKQCADIKSAACKSACSGTGGGDDTVQTKCGITPWSQIDAELKAAKYDGLFDHSQTELDAYNRTKVCEGGGSSAIVAFFRLSEDLTALDTAPKEVYTSPGPVIKSWTFKDPKPGIKTIFVQFYDKAGIQVGEREQASIDLLGGEPTIASCSLSFEGQNVTYEINGTNFGSDKGTITSDSVNLEIKSWSPAKIKAVLANPPTGQSFPITVTNTFGQSVPGQCSAISQVSVGAKVFCSAPSNHDTDNVDLELAGVFKGGKLIKQKVKIDKDGVIQGLDQKLETGKQYKLSLKAPKSLRKTSGVFTAEDGVTTVPNFVLPVGDIFPADGGDSLINAFDHNELVRQWIISADATGRSGDFNVDSRVNSIDWACMRTSMKDNGGSGDDPEPVPGESVAPSSSSAP